MRSVFFFYQGICYIWIFFGGRGIDFVKVYLKKIFEAYFKYGIKCLFSLDFTYAFYYYSLFMYEVDLFLGYYVFLEILCIVYFFILFVYLYLRKSKMVFYFQLLIVLKFIDRYM